MLYNKADLGPGDSVLDIDGAFSFELNFYVDMEEALRANVRKIRFKIYTRDPRKTVGTSIDSKVGTNEYYNERYLVESTGKSSASPGFGFGDIISKTSNNEVSKFSPRSSGYSLSTRSDGSIKQWTIDIGVSDSIVAQFVEDRRKRTLSVRKLIGAQNSGVIDKLAQNYSVEIAPKINVNSDQ